MKFEKWHGIGNDYIIITDEWVEDAALALDETTAQRICDRHFGIGGDGILVVGASDQHDIRMDVWNPDGSRSEMCGNGLRMVARFAYTHNLVDTRTFSINTLKGATTATINDDDTVSVDMGIVTSEGKKQALGDGSTIFTGMHVDVGNPHFVIEHHPTDEVVLGHGPVLENDPAFPNRTNVEFFATTGPQELTMRVWERGVGETLACGSGACATAFAAVKRGIATSPVTVHLPGGTLVLEVRDDDSVIMTGPAEPIYAGKTDAALLTTTEGTPA